MHSTTSAREPLTGFREHDRRHLSFDIQDGHHHSHSVTRGTLGPPRPMEPSPTYHSHLSFPTSSSASRQNTFRNLPAYSDTHNFQTQCLPGLRDILHPRLHVSTSATCTAPWKPNGVVSVKQTKEDSQLIQCCWLPPLSSLSNTGTGLPQAAHQQSGRELPIMEKGALTRPPLQSTCDLPAIPLSGSNDGTIRQFKPSRAPYLPNGFPYPHQTPPRDMSPRAFFDQKESSSVPTPEHRCQRRYLGVEVVRRGGSYHVYEGGYRIPTRVDGELVNPAWGLTKANKPRKRLALACLHCREKKIKCEPGVSSCSRCERAKRPCRR